MLEMGTYASFIVLASSKTGQEILLILLISMYQWLCWYLCYS